MLFVSILPILDVYVNSGTYRLMINKFISSRELNFLNKWTFSLPLILTFF